MFSQLINRLKNWIWVTRNPSFYVTARYICDRLSVSFGVTEDLEIQVIGFGDSRTVDVPKGTSDADFRFIIVVHAIYLYFDLKKPKFEFKDGHVVINLDDHIHLTAMSVLCPCRTLDRAIRVYGGDFERIARSFRVPLKVIEHQALIWKNRLPERGYIDILKLFP